MKSGWALAILCLLSMKISAENICLDGIPKRRVFDPQLDSLKFSVFTIYDYHPTTTEIYFSSPAKLDSQKEIINQGNGVVYHGPSLNFKSNDGDSILTYSYGDGTYGKQGEYFYLHSGILDSSIFFSVPNNPDGGEVDTNKTIYSQVGDTLSLITRWHEYGGGYMDEYATRYFPTATGRTEITDGWLWNNQIYTCESGDNICTCKLPQDSGYDIKKEYYGGSKDIDSIIIVKATGEIQKQYRYYKYKSYVGINRWRKKDRAMFPMQSGVYDLVLGRRPRQVVGGSGKTEPQSRPLSR